MQTTDFKWFEENYSKLQKEHGNSFLAIKDCRVLGAYPSYAEAVRITERTEELGTFIVQECHATGTIYQASIASMHFVQ